MTDTTERWTKKYCADFFPPWYSTSFSHTQYIERNSVGSKFNPCFLFYISSWIISAIQQHKVNVTNMASLNL